MPNPPDTIAGGTWTIRSVLDWSIGYLRDKGVDGPRLDAEVLLAWSLAVDRVRLYMDFDKPLKAEELARFRQALQRRGAREPVAYITGVKEFWGLPLAVTAGVLIPRPETEHLVEAALGLIPESHGGSPWRILDMGTGSGAIALALVSERPGHHYFALDRNLMAIGTARQNIRQREVTSSVHLFASDWASAVAPTIQFDLVITNPPYIRTGDLDSLTPEIRRYEPSDALDGGGDGMSDYRRIFRHGRHLVAPRGHLLMEIGADQGAGILEMAATDGCWGAGEIHRDLAGHDRVVCLGPRTAG